MLKHSTRNSGCADIFVDGLLSRLSLICWRRAPHSSGCASCGSLQHGSLLFLLLSILEVLGGFPTADSHIPHYTTRHRTEPHRTTSTWKCSFHHSLGPPKFLFLWIWGTVTVLWLLLELELHVTVATCAALHFTTILIKTNPCPTSLSCNPQREILEFFSPGDAWFCWFLQAYHLLHEPIFRFCWHHGLLFQDWFLTFSSHKHQVLCRNIHSITVKVTMQRHYSIESNQAIPLASFWIFLTNRTGIYTHHCLLMYLMTQRAFSVHECNRYLAP